MNITEISSLNSFYAGALAFICLIPDLILQSEMLEDIKTYDNLPVCVHRAINVAMTMALNPKWELLVVIFTAFNSSVKVFVYMISNNQFKWTVIYCLQKPFARPENHPPTKNYFAQALFTKPPQRADIRNYGYHGENRLYRSPNMTGQRSANRYNGNTAREAQVYQTKSADPVQRPYIITPAQHHHMPGSPLESPQYGHIQRPLTPSVSDDVFYTEDHSYLKNIPARNQTHGSTRKPGDHSQRPSNHSDSSQRTSRTSVTAPLVSRSNKSSGGKTSLTLMEQSKLHWDEQKLEKFRTRSSGSGSATHQNVSGGPWDDVIEVVV